MFQAKQTKVWTKYTKFPQISCSLEFQWLPANLHKFNDIYEHFCITGNSAIDNLHGVISKATTLCPA